MCTQPNGPMGKSKALKTALYNKLLSSHEHLENVLFSPTPLYIIDQGRPRVCKGRSYTLQKTCLWHSELESFLVGLHSVQRMVSRMVSSKVQSPPCTHRSHAMWLAPQPCCCVFTDGLPVAALQCQHPLGLTCKAEAPLSEDKSCTCTPRVDCC